MSEWLSLFIVFAVIFYIAFVLAIQGVGLWCFRYDQLIKRKEKDLKLSKKM